MGRIKELDGLRALAALLVIAWHYVGIPDGPNYWLWNVFQIGRFGVDLFFILSGFLITTILLENRDSPNYFSSFYGRRALRIWPIYYLMVVMCGMGWASGASPALFQGTVPGWTYLFGIQNFWMAQQQNYGAYWLGGTWSLAIEEQFYLVFPFIVRSVPISILPRLLIGIILVCPVGRLLDSFTSDQFGYYVLPQFRADILAIGAMIAWWQFTGGRSPTVDRIAKRTLIVSCFTTPLVWLTGTSTFHAAAWQHTWAAALFGSAVYLILRKREAPSLAPLRSEIARHFANWSYASYMIHHWVAYLVFVALGVNRTMTTMVGASTTALALILTFAICAISYVLLERPLLKFSHIKFRFTPERIDRTVKVVTTESSRQGNSAMVA